MNFDFIHEDVIGGKKYVEVNVGERADDIAVKTILYSMPSFIPPTTLSAANNEQIISYDVTADRFVQLSMIPDKMTPGEFLAMMKNLTEALVGCDDYFMSPLNFLLTENHIYVNPRTYDVRLIYVPVDEPLFDESEVNGNVFKISRQFAKTESGWNDIVVRMFKMYENTSLYEASDTYRQMYEENLSKTEGKHENKSEHEAYQGLSPSDKINREDYFNRGSGNLRENINVSRPESKPFESEPQDTGKQKREKSFFGRDKSKDIVKDKKAIKDKPEPKSGKRQDGGIFSGSRQQEPVADLRKEPDLAIRQVPVYNDEDDSAQSLPRGARFYTDDDDDGATQPPQGMQIYQDDDTTQPPRYFKMMSARFDYCGEKNNRNLPQIIRIEMNNGKFIIGRVSKSKSVCDFSFPEDTEGVSSIHACITESDGGYYITDMNSKFGTYVEFHKITPTKAVGLNNGDRVSFSMGVDYEFRIENMR